MRELDECPFCGSAAVTVDLNVVGRDDLGGMVEVEGTIRCDDCGRTGYTWRRQAVGQPETPDR